MPDSPEAIVRLMARMDADLARFAPDDARRHFLGVYRRTTEAVGEEIAGGGFVDGEWVERWDVIFAELYLDALDSWNAGRPTPGPWEVAFRTARDEPGLQPLRQILFGMNVHVNYDLPQALLGAISDEEFHDAPLIARRAKDHEHIDAVLLSRVSAEDELIEGKRSLLDRLLAPLNRAGTKRFLVEAREKVWRNAKVMSAARGEGPEALERRLAELDGLCSARVADLVAPGQVILKLARKGFGVLLSGA